MEQDGVQEKPCQCVCHWDWLPRWRGAAACPERLSPVSAWLGVRNTAATQFSVFVSTSVACLLCVWHLHSWLLKMFWMVDDDSSVLQATKSSLREGQELSQFSSVAQLCPTLCNPVDCSTPGLPVHHQLTELAQTHVHWVGDGQSQKLRTGFFDFETCLLPAEPHSLSSPGLGRFALFCLLQPVPPNCPLKILCRQDACVHGAPWSAFYHLFAKYLYLSSCPDSQCFLSYSALSWELGEQGWERWNTLPPALKILPSILYIDWKMSVLLCVWANWPVGFSFVNRGEAHDHPTKTWAWLVIRGHLEMQLGRKLGLRHICWMNSGPGPAPGL